MSSAEHWIRQLRLQKHPEGGYYRETYRSAESIPTDGLPPRFPGARPFATAIYFLLQAPEFSAFHRIKSDEIWHFYYGGALLLHILQPEGDLTTTKLGGPEGVFQAIAPAGCWFAAELAAPDPHALVGCTVAPGFDFADFELAKRDELSRLFPPHAPLIARLTRSPSLSPAVVKARACLSRSVLTT
jgi:predicted cupin superfamily sugar epimerase